MELSAQERQFGYARRLLAVARRDPSVNEDAQFRTKLRQQHALCTYKDPDLAEEIRFDRAIQILSDCDDLHATTDQETLESPERFTRASGRHSLNFAIWKLPCGITSGVMSAAFAMITVVPQSMPLTFTI